MTKQRSVQIRVIRVPCLAAIAVKNNYLIFQEQKFKVSFIPNVPAIDYIFFLSAVADRKRMPLLSGLARMIHCYKFLKKIRANQFKSVSSACHSSCTLRKPLAHLAVKDNAKSNYLIDRFSNYLINQLAHSLIKFIFVS